MPGLHPHPRSPSTASSASTTSSGGCAIDGHDLLRQHIQRIAQEARRLHVALVHRPRHRRARHQVRAILGKDDAVRRRAHLVARAPDALHAAGDRRRRLDLNHQVDRAHVDAQFERAGRDQRLDLPGLQQFLNLDPLRRRQRSMMRARDRLAGKIVQRAGQPLRHPPRIHEDQRRRAPANDLQQPRMNALPDRRPLQAIRSRRLFVGARPGAPCPRPEPPPSTPAACARLHSRSSPAGSELPRRFARYSVVVDVDIRDLRRAQSMPSADS